MPMSLIHKFVCVVAFYLIFVDHKRTCNAFSSFLHEPENTTQEVPSSSSGKSGTNSDYGDIEEKGINSEIAIKPCPTVNFCVSREHCAIRAPLCRSGGEVCCPAQSLLHGFPTRSPQYVTDRLDEFRSEEERFGRLQSSRHPIYSSPELVSFEQPVPHTNKSIYPIIGSSNVDVNVRNPAVYVANPAVDRAIYNYNKLNPILENIEQRRRPTGSTTRFQSNLDRPYLGNPEFNLVGHPFNTKIAGTRPKFYNSENFININSANYQPDSRINSENYYRNQKHSIGNGFEGINFRSRLHIAPPDPYYAFQRSQAYSNGHNRTPLQKQKYSSRRQHIDENYNRESKYGYYRPDFFSTVDQLRKLSPRGSNLLHKYRYTKQCGKRSPLFLPKKDDDNKLNDTGIPEIGQQPWQAAVLGWTDGAYSFRCTATIVHQYLLITSAHCLHGMIEPDMKIVAGSSDLFDKDPLLPSLDRSVATVFIHEKYDPRTLEHDIALLLLENPLNFRLTPHVAPACLPSDTQTLPDSCSFVGWSQYYTPDALSIVRHSIQSKVNIIKDKADCQAMVSQYPRPEYSIDPLKITDQMLCAAGSSDNQRCFNGDSDALLCKVGCSSNSSCTPTTYLAGVLMWSNGYCGSEALAVVTPISSFAWINDILQKAEDIRNFNPKHFNSIEYLNRLNIEHFGKVQPYNKASTKRSPYKSRKKYNDYKTPKSYSYNKANHYSYRNDHKNRNRYRYSKKDYDRRQSYRKSGYSGYHYSGNRKNI